MFGNSSFDDIEIVKLSDSNSDTVTTTNNNNTSNNNNNNDIAFSKKAQHQCDADENLFLRFLELDPPSSDASYSSKGRTPFTLSKKLVKSSECSFGFSIVWTHPPRIEKIEPNSSAEKVGMLPGDYVIFIDKYNVVTMPGKLPAISSLSTGKHKLKINENPLLLISTLSRVRYLESDTHARKFTKFRNFPKDCKTGKR
jgi:hypothetical protein